MIQASKWALGRLKCTVYGHRLVSDRIYYAPAASVIPGYRCERCGRTQNLLYRWQEAADSVD